MLSDLLHVLAGLGIGIAFWGSVELGRWILRRRRRNRLVRIGDKTYALAGAMEDAAKAYDGRRVQLEHPDRIQVEIPLQQRPIFRAEVPYHE